MTAHKDDHTDRQALREEILKYCYEKGAVSTYTDDKILPVVQLRIDKLEALITAARIEEQTIRNAVRQAILADPNDFISITGDMGIYDIESRVVATLTNDKIGGEHGD